MPGPGTYDDEKYPKKKVAVPLMRNADGFTVKFNDQNPLSFVKPLTISIYFKSSNPPVGSYELQGP